MNIDKEFILAVAGTVLILEGIPWFLSPARYKKLLRDILASSEVTLRLLGLTAMVLGLLTVYLGTR